LHKEILKLVGLCRHGGMHEGAATWEQHRLARLMLNRLFGTVTGAMRCIALRRRSP
jgi:UDPglucose 6-dehydrogenase